MQKENYYKDVREHLKALDERGKLVRVKQRINKDTELMPLVRWQFRGLRRASGKRSSSKTSSTLKGKATRCR